MDARTHNTHGPKTKISPLGDLASWRADARKAGRRVVLCHGCFDIVHPGHIRHLRFAKAQGDLLVVTISPDATIDKGAGRPLIPQELRAENLAELDCVDRVSYAPGSTAMEVLETIQPDIYIKGQEYEHNDDPRFAAERRAVESAGGRVVFSSGDVVFSSSALIRSIESSADPVHGRLRQLLDTPELAAVRLGEQIERFRARRIVVVGEVILDTYVFCDRPDVAGEGPILTLRPLEHRAHDGGAAVIALHAAAMGAQPVLVTALPDDEAGNAMRQRLTAAGVDVRSVELPSSLPEKRRFLVETQKIMKVDLVDPIVLDTRQREALIATAEGAAREAPTDAAIITDFGLGLLTPTTIERLIPKLRAACGIVAGDVSGRRSGLLAMHDMDLLCPSEGELRDAVGNHGEGLPAVVWSLLHRTASRAAIVTMGAEGLIGFSKKPGADRDDDAWRSRLTAEHVPALTPHAIDPLGCGDALLSVATLALATGSSLLGASMLGAVAASLEARRLGNVPISAPELRRELERLHGTHLTYAPAEIKPCAGARRAVS